jgi:hypothetical protein
VYFLLSFACVVSPFPELLLKKKKKKLDDPWEPQKITLDDPLKI